MSESKSPNDEQPLPSGDPELNIEIVSDELSNNEPSMDEKLELLAAEFSELSESPPEEPLSEEPLSEEFSEFPQKSSKVLPVLIAVLLLLTVGGMSVAGYFGWQMFQQMSKIEQFDTRLVSLSQQVSKQEAQTGASISLAKTDIQSQSQASQKQLQLKLESQFKNTSNDFRALSSKNQQQVDMLQKRVDGHQQRLLSLSTTSREDWMLAEAEYLLKLANQRVLLERTSENAVALLESADQLVGQVSAGTGDAELFAIRKAISRDLTALKLIEDVDKNGIYLKLQALAELVDQLPRVPNHTFARSSAVTAVEGVDVQTEEGFAEQDTVLNRAWVELKAMAGTLNQYIKIEDATAPAKPLVDQHFTQVAGLNVRLLLEQAQIALLKESAVIYKNSLNQAHELIGQYYITSQPAAEFQKSIAELSAMDIAPMLPDISQSLKLLHDYIRQLHNMEDVKAGQL